ncbi:MAG: pyrroline-5-carboxylate reductase [bacterium]
MIKIGFIGAGKMAEAMMASFIEKRVVVPDEILAGDVSAERLAEISRKQGVRITLDNAEVVRESRVCVLAVKPQQLDAVLSSLAPRITPNHLIISIAAGKTTSTLESLLPNGRVVRVMPNIACLVGEGMNVYTRGARATTKDSEQVARLLGCCGQATELPEALFDAVTALSGSGPAFFAYLLDRFVDGAVQEGIPRKQALTLAIQTMLGTARLLIESGMEPADLARAVTSAKGTTAAGRAVLETPEIADLLSRTIAAAARRSRELAGA